MLGSITAAMAGGFGTVCGLGSPSASLWTGEDRLNIGCSMLRSISTLSDTDCVWRRLCNPESSDPESKSGKWGSAETAISSGGLVNPWGRPLGSSVHGHIFKANRFINRN